MMRLKIFTSAFFIALTLLLTTRVVQASEGTVEITSTQGKSMRCFASSLLNPKRMYRVTVTCRDLIYPPSPDSFIYLLWGNPLDGGSPIRFGELGFGRAEFAVARAFSELYVTAEADQRARAPSGNIVMRGSVKSVGFLEGTPEPTPTPEEKEPSESFAELIEEPTPTPTLIPQQQGGLLAGLRRAGVIFAIAVFVIILIIAAITRSRG